MTGFHRDLGFNGDLMGLDGNFVGFHDLKGDLMGLYEILGDFVHVFMGRLWGFHRISWDMNSREISWPIKNGEFTNHISG